MTLNIARIKEFENVLRCDQICLESVRKLSFNGIPEERGLRPICWKLLLSYLPLDSNVRTSTLQTKRALYKQFIDEIIVSPGGENDHPLNVSPDSSWSNYFKDNEVLLQIDKDVRRLCPEISFFQIATDFPCEQVVNSNGSKRLHSRVECGSLSYGDVQRKGLGPFKIISGGCRNSSKDGDYYSMSEGSEAHWEVVERILFIYAKLNPGQGYVQGMNEIIGPIYHTFANDPDITYREYAEADCFFCFTNLMSEIRDFFIKSLDEAEGGVNHLIQKFEKAMRTYDSEIWERLNELDLKPQYYSFRWLTLLLSQEFPLPDVERIWDSLFADKNRFDFLIDVCCAMVILSKDLLMTGDFASNLKHLQSFPPMDVTKILSTAVNISNGIIYNP